MVLVPIDVDGEKKELYVDHELYKRIQTKIKPKLEKKDFDWIWVVDGGEGTGKSQFSMGLCKLVDPTFNLDRVCMTPNEFTKAIVNAKPRQAVLFDEGFTGLSSRQSLSEINRLIVSLIMEMRQKNLFVVIAMPTIFLLDRYVALFRARGLFHIYTKDGRRGRWVYFNNKSKKLLYIYGKKLFNYSKPKSRFRGRFTDHYVVNEMEYRKKKADALMKKSRQTKTEIFKHHRDLLFYILDRKLKIDQIRISNLCKKVGWNISRNAISEISSEVYKDLVKNDIKT